MVVGVAAFWFASSRSTPALRTLAVLGIVASVGLLVLVLAPGFGTSSFGASRWLGFGWLRVQPSEFAKFALCLYAAHVITKKERVETEWGRVLRPLAIVTALVRRAARARCSPTWARPSSLIAIALAVATAAGAPWRALSCSIGLLALGCAVAAVALPYRRERLLELPAPPGRPLRERLPAPAVQDRSRRGPPVRRSALGNSPREVGLPAQPAHRLHLLDRRRRARASSARSSSSGSSSHWCCSGSAWRRTRRTGSAS